MHEAILRMDGLGRPYFDGTHGYRCRDILTKIVEKYVPKDSVRGSCVHLSIEAGEPCCLVKYKQGFSVKEIAVDPPEEYAVFVWMNRR